MNEQPEENAAVLYLAGETVITGDLIEACKRFSERFTKRLWEEKRNGKCCQVYNLHGIGGPVGRDRND